MSFLIQREVLEAAPVSPAADLARYGSTADWRAVYYRGEKIGFSVSETVATEDGYELRENGQLQLNLMGMTRPAITSTRAVVDSSFGLRSFSFSLDPGTGPITVAGALDGTKLTLDVETPAGKRSETRVLDEPPNLLLNLPRRLAAEGLEAGRRLTLDIFDPATMRNSPAEIEIKDREVVRLAGRPVPAFRVQMKMSGIVATAWITDVGEVVREESPLGLIVVKESRERATTLALPGDVEVDMLQASAITPKTDRRIDDPRTVQRLRVRITGAELSGDGLQGAGQTLEGDELLLVDARTLLPGPVDPDAARYLASEMFIESDDPAIRAEALVGAAGATDRRTQAERLVRYVNSIIEKKPTVSLPSASEVLRTRVGDCNEHTVLLVAMARSLGIPARIAVGLVHFHGAFYYHAWPELYLEEEPGSGLWLPVDPTLNQFPADATHIRLARGGLEQQAVVAGFIGRAEIEILELEVSEEATPILVGQENAAVPRPLALPLPRREGGPGSCWRSDR